MNEATYQAGLIKRLRDRFPDCVILKNDSGYMQGIPDLLILWGPRWGTLEVKISENAPVRPNQPYYVAKLGEMGFSAFIYPSNESEILDALETALRSGREDSRLPVSE